MDQRRTRHLLTASGFYVAQMDNIRANVHDDQASIILVECSFEESSYREALARSGIVSKNVSSVMITTEYPGLVASGGIGTFVADWHRSNDSSVVLTTFEFDRKRKLESDVVFGPSDVVDVSRIDDIGTADVMLQAVTQLLLCVLISRKYTSKSTWVLGCVSRKPKRQDSS